MATKKSSSRKSRGILKFFLGFLFAFVVLFVGGFAYLKYGHPPVAAADPAFPLEAQIIHVPLGARIDKEMQQPPFGISEDVYEDGAHIYVQQCASCHGRPSEPVAYAKWMYPASPQLWKKHTRNNAVGVSDDEPGETFWKVKNGIRLSGMPAYQHVLTDEQMWDVSLLVKNADQQLPDPVVAILKSK
jgi:thiosulfate dehydrogenase